MSPGAEFGEGTMLFTQTSRADFEDLSSGHPRSRRYRREPRNGVRGLHRTA